MATMWPIDAPITQRFGTNPNSYQPDGHTGIDFGAPTGTPLRAPANGVVLYANWAQGLGWPNPYWIAIDFDGPQNGDQSAGIVLVIDHRPYGIPFVSIMAHLNQTGLEPGMHVKMGELVAQVGNTGFSFGSHLHFEVLPDGWNVHGKWYGRVDPGRMIGYTTKPNPDAAFLRGVDVSSHQTGIDFNPLTADFAIIKVTGGTGYVNPAAAAQFASAAAAGTRRGIYHFIRERGYEGTAEAEAEHFLQHGGRYLDGNTLTVMDWEPHDIPLDTGYALRFLSVVEARTGLKPWIYMNSSLAQNIRWDEVIRNGNPLWVAGYGNDAPVNGYTHTSGARIQDVAHPHTRWGKPIAWQFSQKALITGWPHRIDANIFYGGDHAWLQYCRPFGLGTASMEEDMYFGFDRNRDNRQTQILESQEADYMRRRIVYNRFIRADDADEGGDTTIYYIDLSGEPRLQPITYLEWQLLGKPEPMPVAQSLISEQLEKQKPQP